MGHNRNSFLLNFVTLIIHFLVLIWSVPVFSRDSTVTSSKTGMDRIQGNIKFLPIPYVNYNRSFGYQIGAAPMLLFNPVSKDTLSPSSLAGVIGIYSENKTWFIMGYSKLYLDEDNWRMIVVGGSGSYNFQFLLDSPINSWIPYNTKLGFIFGQVQRRIINELYAGLSLIHMDLKTKTDSIEIESNTKLNGLGLRMSMDQRSSTRYPKSGFETNVKYFIYPKFLDNKTTSSKIEIDFDHFLPMREKKDVIASRLYIGLGLGDLNFNQQLIVGRKDIRGYTQGAYRGDYLLAAQSEYRWNFLKRWGMVYFLGLATVFKSINENDNGKLLPGIGTGFRFTVDRETKMNVGIDVAAGIDDWGFYFRIGEAF